MVGFLGMESDTGYIDTGVGVRCQDSELEVGFRYWLHGYMLWSHMLGYGDGVRR